LDLGNSIVFPSLFFSVSPNGMMGGASGYGAALVATSDDPAGAGWLELPAGAGGALPHPAARMKTTRHVDRDRFMTFILDRDSGCCLSSSMMRAPDARNGSYPPFSLSHAIISL
jgi:hypothetical protein